MKSDPLKEKKENSKEMNLHDKPGEKTFKLNQEKSSFERKSKGGFQEGMNNSEETYLDQRSKKKKKRKGKGRKGPKRKNKKKKKKEKKNKKKKKKNRKNKKKPEKKKRKDTTTFPR